MSVHYKFKTALEYDTVLFDGLHISIKDLKKQILQQKKIGKSTDFDLQITNAQTKETYTDENQLIPKNTSVIVARVPVSGQVKKQWDRDGHGIGTKTTDNTEGGVMGMSVDIAKLDLSEEDKIKTMMSQSTSEYDPSNYVKVKGGNQFGPVPPHYLCHKCHQRGHWIKDCKASSDGVNIGEPIKKSSGIPRSFMIPVEGPQVPGARMTPSGAFAVPAIDHQVYKVKKIEKPPFLAEKEAPVDVTPIPEDLLCVICKDLMQDAVMAPCCGHSFCDDCIRCLLIESEDAECPECNEKDVSPDTLIPNRFLRNSVNNFKNKTGYTKRSNNEVKGKSPPRPSLPDFVPPGSEKVSTNDVTKERLESKSEVKKGSDTNSFLYDVAVENKSANENSRKSPTDSRERGKPTENEKTKRSNSDYVPKNGAQPVESSKPDNGVYTIPSLVPAYPPNMPPNVHHFHHHRNHHNFMHGERSGTPTVDERYENYGRPGPVAHGPGPGPGMDTNFPLNYNPTYPPPLVNQYGGGYRDRGRPYRGRYNSRHHEHSARPLIPLDGEDPYEAFERMLREKEERDKRKHSARSSRSRSRPLRDSRSRSISASRSQSRPRSRSRQRSHVRSISKSPSDERRRSYSPRVRAKPPRRSRSGSFVMSRSRSISYDKSPINRRFSPKKYQTPPRSPYRYERNRDEYGPDSNFDWDRKDRRQEYGAKGRGGESYTSPHRNYPTFNRYDEYDPPPRSYPSPNRYVDQRSRGYPAKWNDARARRSRSISPHRQFYEEPMREIDERISPQSSRVNRNSPLDDRRKRRDDREQYSRHYSKEKEKTREGDKKREKSPSEIRTERSRNNRRKSPPRDRRRSNSPKKARRDSKSPVNRHDVRRSLSIEKNAKTSMAPKQDDIFPSEKFRPILEEKPLEPQLLARNPSPMLEKQKTSAKKEKKKDREKKKKKREKETEEEKEARRKRKKEKKEEKKRKLGFSADHLTKPVVSNSTTSVAVNNDDHEKFIPVEKNLVEPSTDSKYVADAEKLSEPEQPNEITESVTEGSIKSEEVSETVNTESVGLNISFEEPEDEMLAPVPELSRWELEETGQAAVASLHSPTAPRDQTTVTSEVIKRAENAIFKKTPSAQRPDPTKKLPDKADYDKKPIGHDKDLRSESPEKEKKHKKEEGSKQINNKETRDDSQNKKVSGREHQEETSKRHLISDSDTSKRSVSVKQPDDSIKTQDNERIHRELPIKAKSDSRKPSNSIQVIIPVSSEKENRDAPMDAKPKLTLTPARVSVKHRLGNKIDETMSSHVSRKEERSRPTLLSSVEAIDKRPHLDEAYFVPIYEQSSDEDDKRGPKRLHRSPEIKKRLRTSSESSEDSERKQKKKKSKSKKEKRSKKRNRKDVSESTDSSESEVERKRHKKSKKKKKLRH